MLVSAVQRESATSIHCPLPPRPGELYKQEALGRSLPLPSPRSLQQWGVTVQAAVKQPCGNAYTRVLLVTCSPGLILAHCMGSREEVPGQGGIVTIWARQGSGDLEAVTSPRGRRRKQKGRCSYGRVPTGCAFQGDLPPHPLLWVLGSDLGRRNAGHHLSGLGAPIPAGVFRGP